MKSKKREMHLNVQRASEASICLPAILLEEIRCVPRLPNTYQRKIIQYNQIQCSQHIQTQYAHKQPFKHMGVEEERQVKKANTI